MKYLVLGDIHGQYDRLREILDKYFSISDKVIFLGDYIDKNKDSIKTLDFIIELKKENINKVEILWGNHEIFLTNGIIYKDKNIFKTWFYLNKAYKTTLFDYVPGNDRVLFMDGYEEFIDEYFEKLSTDDRLLKLGRDLIDLGKLYYKDNKGFFIHGGIPINVINRNEFKYLDFYDGVGEKSLKVLQNDYKKGLNKSINFFSKTTKYDPTWFAGAHIYESITMETFNNLLSDLKVNYMFLGHRDGINNPKYPKGDNLHCLNMGDLDIGYFYGELI
ncbi:MAG: metallophosphoesterase [Candidatus Gracilibacteria bacterium]|nr:metallophosphoesterase [Candidatus Gracilibacteria bacterium]